MIMQDTAGFRQPTNEEIRKAPRDLPFDPNVEAER
jgi:hypothetical protein